MVEGIDELSIMLISVRNMIVDPSSLKTSVEESSIPITSEYGEYQKPVLVWSVFQISWILLVSF